MNKGIVVTIGTTIVIIAVFVHLMSIQIALSREVKADLRDLRSDFKADLRDLRSEFKMDFKDLRSDFKDLRSDFKDLRSEFKDLRSEFKVLRSEFKGLKTAITDDTDNKFRLHIAEHHQSTAGSGAELVGALAGDDQAAIPSN